MTELLESMSFIAMHISIIHTKQTKPEKTKRSRLSCQDEKKEDKRKLSRKAKSNIEQRELEAENAHGREKVWASEHETMFV